MSLFNELKRRNVFKVGAAYILVAWLLLQISDTLVPALLLPEWFHSGVAFILIMGFPIAMIFAWAFELTPEGLKKEKEVERSASIAHQTGRKINYVIIGTLAVAVILLVGRLSTDEDNTSPGSTSVRDKSIAVLPFANQSADEENAEFFAAGVHDELLTLLSKLGDLKVISRTSVERLDTELNIPEIGALLNVATVLEGQVQRAGDRLRINVQLIDATHEDHLWATTYDRELTAENIFDVQSNIAKTIADELHLQLSPQDELVLDAVPTRNTEALYRYLLGRQELNRASFDAFRKAGDSFREATRLDAEFAEAWAAIAETEARLLVSGIIEAQEYIANAEPVIARALALDDQLPAAHAELGNLHWFSGDLVAAEKSFREALELNPRDSVSLQTYGRYLRTTGRPLEAIPVFENALREDPLSVELLFELGRAEMYSGNVHKNIEYGNRILEIDPTSVSGYAGSVQANLWIGRYDLMWPWFLNFFKIDPEDYENWAHMGLYADQLGDPDLADRYMERALTLGPDEPAVLKCYAQVLAQRARNDEALAIAHRALDAGADDRWFSTQVFLRLVRDEALQTGEFDEALRWYRERHPELFNEVPEILVENVNAAADLAYLLQRAGEVEAANEVIDAGLAWYRHTQPANDHGYLVNIVDVQLLALKGETQDAIETLQEAADHGWGFAWRWNLSNHNLDSIRNTAEFQAVLTQLEDDMVTQLTAVHALPDMGEFDLR